MKLNSKIFKKIITPYSFYDAVGSKSEKIGKNKMKEIARKLKKRLKEKADLDWANRTKMRAKMRSEVKQILRSEGLSHTQYEPIIEPVLEQAKVFYASIAQ